MPSPKDYNLSEGSLQEIMSGGQFDNPIMQVLGTKKINSGGGDKEKIRILLSDGRYTISYAMLTTQINDKVGPKALENYSVIQIDKYVTSIVNSSGKGDARVLLILDMHVIVPGSDINEKIGSPVVLPDLEKRTNSSSASSNTVASSSKTYKPTVNGNGTANLNNSMDTTKNLAGQMTHPISSLTPYQNKWVIRARVTNKSAIKTWSNSRGEGKLFSMDLIDESGEIRCTGFKEHVDKFYDYIEVDKVYYISKCQLKPANKQFSTLKNEYEMTITNDTVIQECQDDSSVPQTQYNFVTIDKIAEKEPNSIVDLVGVVKSVGDVITFQAKNTGRELKKKAVILVDQSQTAIELSLWGNEAESFDGTNNPVVVIKGAKVSEFNGGKSLTTISGTSIKINPELKECYRIRGWYDREGSTLDSKNISAKTGSGSFNTNWMSFKEVKDQNLGSSERGDYYQVLGTILLLKAENIIYKACPTQDCNKKIIDMENGMYRCEKCNKEYPNFKYRLLASMNVGDHSGNQWISMFSSEVEKILGMTSEEVGRQIENGANVSEIVDKAHFKKFVLKCRVKLESYNDEARLKTVCVKVDPINYEEYNSYLIGNIKQLIA